MEQPITEGQIRMNEQTMTKLNEMKLNGMAEAYEEQVAKRDF